MTQDLAQKPNLSQQQKTVTISGVQTSDCDDDSAQSGNPASGIPKFTIRH